LLAAGSFVEAALAGIYLAHDWDFKDATRRELRRLAEDPSINEPLLPATLYVLSGDWNAADQWLDRCYRARSPNMIFLHLVRDLQSDDPRYQAWLDVLARQRVMFGSPSETRTTHRRLTA